METVIFVALFVVFGGITLLTSYLDAKYQWRLNDWLNGRCSNPFERRSATETDEPRDELKARIETLEAIVTEPAYELNKKINALK
ncbi:hypothetical protein OCL06_03020 [Alteromonas sp. ASW11-19]|uniref:Phage shock protein B n=1 Tax=Alteromonas salexigens TaxID=2982530 RepID=A0ABT2VKL7_9ALTE|nr:hypothetical protein [Alteromonas salexigens]MCU7553569.1 hypothetical protein [Alteromonas salexigens]